MNAWKRIALTCLALVALGLVPAGTALAQVKVTSATPSWGYQGTTLDVVVGGSGFDRTAKVKYYLSGTTDPSDITVVKVVYRKSTELLTTIAVAGNADLASFDIEVTLDSGRKGKGTTLFKVETQPTYPAARSMQSFTANGGTTSATSRLYMFGGSDGVAMNDLWFYANAGSTGAAWVFIPGGSVANGTVPATRHGGGWSCGSGLCVLAGGVSTKYYSDTWIFNESTRTWSSVTCGRRVVCPAARAHPAMAYDPDRGVHVMFGGDSGNVYYLSDTYTFSTATKTWTNKTSAISPPARAAAAATYVPGVGVVLFGGMGYDGSTFFNDMYAWDGAQWLPVASTVVSDPPRPVPSVWGHSMAWDPIRGALIVAKGLLDSGWTPSEDTWYVTFAKSGGAWRATWTLASGIGCQAAVAAGSPPDPIVHAGAQMAFDPVAGVQVFFGGGGNSIYGNTVECR